MRSLGGRHDRADLRAASVTGYGPALFPRHAELLRASAISPEVARERGYVSVDSKSQLAPFKDWQRRNIPGLLIPIHDTTGAIATWQYRPDKPRVTKAKKPRTVKYETPADSRLVLDVPPRIREQLDDPKVALWITEGARKADAAVSAGLCCVALAGVDAWQGTNDKGGKTALADWKDVALNGRRVYLAFDSDAASKPDVAGALERLGLWLATRKADVRYCYLPDVLTDAKTGLDDYLAAGRSIDDLIETSTPKLIAAEIEAELSAATPAKSPHTRTPGADQPEQVCKPDGVCMHTPLLAHEPDLLAKVVKTVHDLGVAGEDRVIRGTYLTALSQVLAEPISLVVKGTSAGGKSYSTKTTLLLFPADDFYSVTAGSQRSLIFTDEEFSHRTIVMFEATALREVAEKRDGDMTAMIVRTLLSEGRIVYDMTERGDDGKMGARRIVKEGPTNLIVTTTADNLHNENETRLLSLTVDESEDQTRAVLRKIAARRNQFAPAEPPDLTPWHELFHWLKHHGEHRVYIPYAEYLADVAAAAVVRMRRDFSTLLGMIEAHAIAHQATRKRDQYSRILATEDDYKAALCILAEAFAVSSGQQIKDSVRRAVTAVADLGGVGKDVTVAEVARHLKRDRTVVTRGLKESATLGYLTNQEDKQGKPARYRSGPDSLPEDKPALPPELPSEACTPTHLAHLSPQVSEGCADVQAVQGCAAADPSACSICGELLAPALIEAEYTEHDTCTQSASAAMAACPLHQRFGPHKHCVDCAAQSEPSAQDDGGETA